jgi:hypothetical protein
MTLIESVRWRNSCTLLCTCGSGERLGCHLTTLFSSTVIPAVVPVAPKQKRGWLPLLTVLFMLSYGLMTMLIVEQGQTIESQRVLIHELYRDSSELSAVKGKAVMDKNMAAQRQAQTQAPGAKNQAPTVQTPSTQTPSTQATPQHRTQAQPGKVKPQFQAPPRPAVDIADDRRTLITI